MIRISYNSTQFPIQIRHFGPILGSIISDKDTNEETYIDNLEVIDIK